MSFLKRIPSSLDYVLGILMVISGAIMVYEYWDIWANFDLVYELRFQIAPRIALLFGGILLLAIPGKNIRRTIWLCGLILGINFALMGYQFVETFMEFRPYMVDLITYVVAIFTFGIIYIGCSIAVILNSVIFAANRTKSIYPIVIAIILAFTVDYFDAQLSYSIVVADSEFYTVSEFIQSFLLFYLPHMLLLVLFAFMFVSDEVSWYTAKGGMRRAISRLETAGAVFAINTFTREQLVLLMQCRYDFSTVLVQEEYFCRLDVLSKDDGKTLVFYRVGEDSMAGALYVKMTSIVPQGSLSECTHAEIYGEDGFYMRIHVVDSTRRKIRRYSMRALLDMGVVPSFRLSVFNSSLGGLVTGTGRFPLFTKKSRGKFEIEVTEKEGIRYAEVFRDGVSVYRMNIIAAVPVCEFGEYTKFFLYGDMGRVLALKVRPYSMNVLDRSNRN